MICDNDDTNCHGNCIPKVSELSSIWTDGMCFVHILSAVACNGGKDAVLAGICYGCDDDSNAHHLVLQVYNGESRILRACVCCARAGIWVGTDISIYRIIGIAYRKSLDICTLESVHVSFTKT